MKHDKACTDRSGNTDLYELERGDKAVTEGYGDGGCFLVVLGSVVIRAGCGFVLAGLLVIALRNGVWSLAVHAILRVGPTALALALATTLLSMIISGVVWTGVLWCLDYRASVREGLTIYAGTGLAAYVGLGAGAMGQCVLLLRRRGVGAGRAALLMAIVSLVGFCGSLVWAPWGVILLDAPAAIHALPALGARLPLVALVATVACGVGAVVALWLITLGARWRVVRIAAGLSTEPLQLYLHHLLALIPLASLAWLVGAGPLWVLLQAAAPGVVVSLPAVIAVQSVAAVVGAMTFFLPNGLGARDGIIVALLVGILGVPLPAAAAATLLVRVSDPVAKALILLVLAVLGWTPTLGHWHRNVQNRLCLSLVAALACTLLGTRGTAAADQQALTSVVSKGIRRSPESKVGHLTGTLAELRLPTAHAEPTSISGGPDGNLWFTEVDNKIGRIPPAASSLARTATFGSPGLTRTSLPAPSPTGGVCWQPLASTAGMRA